MIKIFLSSPSTVLVSYSGFSRTLLTTSLEGSVTRIGSGLIYFGGEIIIGVGDTWGSTFSGVLVLIYRITDGSVVWVFPKAVT